MNKINSDGSGLVFGYFEPNNRNPDLGFIDVSVIGLSGSSDF